MLFLISYSNRNIRIRTSLKWNQLPFTGLHSFLCDRCSDFDYFQMFPSFKSYFIMCASYRSYFLIIMYLCVHVVYLLRSLSVHLNISGMGKFSREIVKPFQIWLKLNKHNGCFAGRCLSVCIASAHRISHCPKWHTAGSWFLSYCVEKMLALSF